MNFVNSEEPNEERRRHERSRLIIDVFFNGRVGSAFTRLSSTELANVSSGGGMVPTFIIGERS